MSKSNSDDQDDDEEDDDLIDFDSKDWREFRARLVRKQDKSSSNDDASNKTTTEPPSQLESWAYDSGNVIEEGSIILSQPQQDFCNGLQQQYFHKCAILVLQHDENEFTKGIILNRPSDLVLSDDDFLYEDGTPLENADEQNKWRVWFGGDVHGTSSVSPEILCLHSLKCDAAKEVSTQLLKDIQWTSFEGARKLVDDGEAKSTDFWVFCGYCGWNPGQLLDELERKTWYMVATDSQTLLKELAKQSIGGSDPREAGIDTWNMLMSMIHRRDEAERASANDFEDLMLREWAREELVYKNDKEDEDDRANALDEIKALADTTFESIDALMQRAVESSELKDLHVGSLVRGSSMKRSPFLLSSQEFHKSIVLITQDDDNFTIGILLNHPSTKTVDLHISRGNNEEEVVSVPQRYGGRYGIAGEVEKPFIWLHYSKVLRNAKVGSPLGDDLKGIYKCSPKDAAEAISAGIASRKDFLAVNGFSLWPKAPEGIAGGMQSEVWQGNFEVVPPEQTQEVWNKLASQELLTTMTFDKNLLLTHAAWNAAASKDKGETIESTPGDHEDDTVFKSNVPISTLCDDALRKWVAAFLLGEPALLREEQSSSFD